MTAGILLVLRLLLAFFLLLFIGYFFVSTWKQLKTKVDLMSSSKVAQLNLYYPDNQSTPAFTITESEALLGRDPICKIHIADETVSVHHARLYFVDQNWWIEDLNSTNGTFLNGDRIEQACVLTDDDKLQVGSVKFSVKSPAARDNNL